MSGNPESHDYSGQVAETQRFLVTLKGMADQQLQELIANSEPWQQVLIRHCLAERVGVTLRSDGQVDHIPV